MNKIKAECTDCGANYNVNSTQEEDEDFRTRNIFIPIIICGKCGNEEWKLFIREGK